jgi:hypothetical protein
MFRLLDVAALRRFDDRDHVMTTHGRWLSAELGVDADDLTATRRIFAPACIDWTSRRPHPAGALPAAITGRFLTLEWLSRTTGRGLRVASDDDQHLDQWLSPSTRPRAD